MTIEQAYHALNSPYLDHSKIFVSPESLDESHPVQQDGGTWFTCRVHVPDAAAEEAKKRDPYFPGKEGT